MTNPLHVYMRLADIYKGFIFSGEEDRIEHYKDTISNLDDITRLEFLVSSLPCFRYRLEVEGITGFSSFWNPLEETYRKYIERHADFVGEMNVSLLDTQYPSSDIIKRWVNRPQF